jgi:spermidine/putrescine transport system ATP-binding protein
LRRNAAFAKSGTTNRREDGGLNEHHTSPSGHGAAAVISLRNVHKRFGTFVAVECANFDIPRGQFFSLLGPSGCGKTTMLRLIGGFEDATGGCICLDGIDVSRVPPHRRNVNTVFQQYALFPHLSVFDNVAFGPRSKRLDEPEVAGRVGRMLAIVRLADYAERRPDQLSGGQRQRVALARALVNLPSALLLDEPLSALDLKLRQAMQLELKRIQRELGITFVFVTHDQEEALTMSDRIAVMNEGRIEQVGTPEEIYHAPATVFVAGFIGTANLLAGTIERVDDRRALVRLAAGGCADVALDGAAAAGDEVVVMLRPERLRLDLTSANDRPNSIEATVTELIFQGPVLRCVLRDDAGDEIVAHVHPDQRPAGLERGRRLRVSWEPPAARLLPPRR